MSVKRKQNKNHSCATTKFVDDGAETVQRRSSENFGKKACTLIKMRLQKTENAIEFQAVSDYKTFNASVGNLRVIQ